MKISFTGIVIGLLLITCVVLGYFTYQHFTKPEVKISPLDVEILNQAKVNAKVEANITKQIADQYGVSHAIATGVDNFITIAEYNALSDSIVAKDQINEVLREKVARLESYIRVMASVNKPNTPLDKNRDEDSFSLQTDNLSLTISPPDSLGNRYLTNYRYNIDWNYLTYSKRGLLRRKYYTDTWVNDTSATIEGLRRFTIQHTPPAWSFQLSGTGDYNQMMGLSYGGTASLRYKAFNLQTSYLYNHNDQNWFPHIRLHYNLIDY